MITSFHIERWPQRLPPNPAMLRHILMSEGYEVFQWGDSPGSVIPLHKNDRAQTHWIVSGSLEITVERYGTEILGAGDRGFVPAETYHSVRVIGEESVVYLVGEK